MPRSPFTTRHHGSGPSPHVSAGVSGALGRAITHLHGRAQFSNHVFASPLGPFSIGERSYWIPRFAYFGPQSSDASVRLAVYAGVDGADSRPTHAVLRLIERLLLNPDLGHGLHLGFFPAVNPSGLEHGQRTNRRGADLAREHWNLSGEPEIALLAADARTHAYHGFIRIEAAPIVHPAAVLRSGSRAASGRDTVLVPPAVPGESFPVRWVVDAERAIAGGPLTLADDLVDGPFEMALALPNVWDDEVFAEAAAQVLRRFFLHYRSAYAYGIHL